MAKVHQVTVKTYPISALVTGLQTVFYPDKKMVTTNKKPQIKKKTKNYKTKNCPHERPVAWSDHLVPRLPRVSKQRLSQNSLESTPSQAQEPCLS